MAEHDNEIYNYQPLWGNWYIDMPIGKGSFGSVYKISREEMGNRYTSAVKIISIPNDEQYREAEASIGHDEGTLTDYFEDIVKNIINEINMLYSLSGNSNIVAYHDHKIVKKENRIGWDVLIRMEYVTSLRNYLSNHLLSRGEIIKLGIDICSALELCSKKGIIHRDIKDENIFLNDDGVFKIGDFGIARELSKSGRAASMRGTPLYMAPEIFRGDKYDAAVDIYSLGIVMYKLLNMGRMPFMPAYPQPVRLRDSEEALERRMTGEALPLPAKSGVALGTVVLKACAFKASDRYPTAAEMKKVLELVLRDMPAEECNEMVTVTGVKKEASSSVNKEPASPADNGENLLETEKKESKTISIFGAGDSAAIGSDESEYRDAQDCENRTVSIFGNATEEENRGVDATAVSDLVKNDNAIEQEPESYKKDSDGGGSSGKGHLTQDAKILYIVAFALLLFALIFSLSQNKNGNAYDNSVQYESTTQSSTTNYNTDSSTVTDYSTETTATVAQEAAAGENSAVTADNTEPATTAEHSGNNPSGTEKQRVAPQIVSITVNDVNQILVKFSKPVENIFTVVINGKTYQAGTDFLYGYMGMAPEVSILDFREPRPEGELTFEFPGLKDSEGIALKDNKITVVLPARVTG